MLHSEPATTLVSKSELPQARLKISKAVPVARRATKKVDSGFQDFDFTFRKV